MSALSRLKYTMELCQPVLSRKYVSAVGTNRPVHEKYSARAAASAPRRLASWVRQKSCPQSGVCWFAQKAARKTRNKEIRLAQTAPAGAAWKIFIAMALCLCLAASLSRLYGGRHHGPAGKGPVDGGRLRLRPTGRRFSCGIPACIAVISHKISSATH